jgi:hypothetical protein
VIDATAWTDPAEGCWSLPRPPECRLAARARRSSSRCWCSRSGLESRHRGSARPGSSSPGASASRPRPRGPPRWPPLAARGSASPSGS